MDIAKTVKANEFPGNLSPRRKLYADAVLKFLCFDRPRWRDGVIRIEDGTYGVIADRMELDKCEVNQALDDLYALGAVGITVSENGLQQVTVLIEEFPEQQPPEDAVEVSKSSDLPESVTARSSTVRPSKFSRRPRVTMFGAACPTLRGGQR